jgi:RNA polymerase sigma-70 factor (ECF subfamily)
MLGSLADAQDIVQPKRRFEIDRDEAMRVATAFFDAMRTGNPVLLRDLLAEAATFHSDGGGKVPAALQIVVGAEKIGRFIVGRVKKHGLMPLPWSRPLWINGLPGYVSIDPAGNVQTTALEIADGKIVAVYVVRNPDKLAGAAAFVAACSRPAAHRDWVGTGYPPPAGS